MSHNEDAEAWRRWNMSSSERLNEGAFISGRTDEVSHRLYKGLRLSNTSNGTVRVLECNCDGGVIHESLLNPHYDVKIHSSNGFTWGGLGNGESQLALAILVNEIGRDKALEIYQIFKQEIVSKFDSDDFYITSYEVEKFVNNLEKRSA